MKKLFYIVFPIVLTGFIITFLFYVTSPKPNNENNNGGDGGNNTTPPTITYATTMMENRVYLKNSKLIGDETFVSSTTGESIKITESMLKHFDTSTKGKKTATISYDNKEEIFTYYVLDSETDTSLNCIAKVNNLYTTYYIDEELNLANASIEYHEVVGGYMKKMTIALTKNMITDFSSSSVGTKALTITHKSQNYKFTYYVKAKSIENINSNSFSRGKYYSADTVEETTHFVIKIHAGSYLPYDYKSIIEKMYTIQQEVSGLKFADKLTIEVYKEYHPSCGGLTIYINASELFTVASNAFQHELAHALDHSQIASTPPSRTLSEGFGTYIEYLTAVKIRESYPELSSITGSQTNVLSNNHFLGNKMYLYDFEERILNLKQDEIAPNSPYEAGARFFAYLHHKYGDFCGWMKKAEFKDKTLSEWKTLIKAYYNDENVFNGFYAYEQALGDNLNGFSGANNFSYFNNHTSIKDFSTASKLNYYFNFGHSKQYQGSQTIIYKDLYLNLESAKDQLTKSSIDYSDLKLKTDKNITIELYNSSGTLIQTVTNTTSAFSVKNVSFIKLVGSGAISLSLTY